MVVVAVCLASVSLLGAVVQAASPVDLGDGLVKIVEDPGDGKIFPQEGDSVAVHYSAALAGRGDDPFDSTKNKMPFNFVVGAGDVIKGWDLGIIWMSLGEKSTLFVPAALGYGERGAGNVVPPNADLEFVIEVVRINDAFPPVLSTAGIVGIVVACLLVFCVVCAALVVITRCCGLWSEQAHKKMHEEMEDIYGKPNHGRNGDFGFED
eukprot:gnl/TRDRNA2_/TRDRNA2_36540_c0_seq1.p1 gnl/TRDRNA2_/TRDRNA2_36540_c0~~gnl/TRDRNA2_/TRDRNA2_36540_c0_seq1.p1  ORF type:complete len:218 (-),score=48.00 gnl/TRDRNA2_/TRDRNA2_36540_c0_seq1:215-838(-)